MRTMKQILALGFCLFSCCSYAQKITIKVSGSPDSVLKVQYPVGGVLYFDHKKSYTLDADGKVSFNHEMKAPAWIRLINNGKASRVFVEPDKNVEIDISGSGTGYALKADGANAAGIELVQKLSHPFYQQKSKEYSTKDSLMAGIEKAALWDMGREISPFDSLLKKNAISPEFYKAISTDIRYYYASVMATAVFMKYYYTTVDKKHPYYKSGFEADFEAAWPKIYKDYSPKERYAMSYPDFYYYAMDYTTWYNLMYLAKKKGTYEEPFDAKNRFDKVYNGFALNFDGDVLEYLRARYIHDEAMQQDYEPELLDLFSRFKKSYPSSLYLTYLKPLIEKVEAFQETTKSSFKTDQVLLKSVDSFDELIGSFKDKMVYVDMWATWCGPCKAEFKYNAGLKKFLKESNIDMLYISMDKPEADQQWQQMIRYYDLSGKHIRTSDQLRQDLINRFWDGKGYGIPRYLIIKNGKVVENNAMRPGDEQKLYRQLQGYL